MSSYIFAGAFAVSLLGSVVQAVCGFGYGPLNMSLLPYLLPYAQAVALAGLCGSTTAVMVAVSGWRYVNWRKVWPCTVTSVILSGFFVWLTNLLNNPMPARSPFFRLFPDSVRNH